MSNYAALIGPICISGCLTNAGTPNVNGKVWAFIPGTTTPAIVYADPAATVSVTQPITLDTGGRVPYSTYPNGVYTTQPIRLLIQDATGQNVSDTTFEGGAGSTGIDNATPSVTTAPFTGATVADALAAIQASVGGQDVNYVPFLGLTPISLKAAISAIQLTPQNFGAKGDGSADDTAAVQAMVTKLAALGGGAGYFPAGTYKLSTAITFPTNAVGIALRGAGFKASIITQFGAGATCINGSNVNGLEISGLTVQTTTGGVALSLANASNVYLRQAFLNAPGSGGIGLGVTSSVGLACVNSAISGGAIAVKLSGTSANHYYANVNPGASAIGYQFVAGFGGGNIVVVDGPLLLSSATPFDVSAITTDPTIIQRGNMLDNIRFSVPAATGTTNVIPDSLAFASTIVSSTGGGTILVKPPALTPNANLDGKIVEMHFLSEGASNCTFSFDAIYALTAGVSGTAGARTTVGLYWDNDTAKWRERYRAATT